ncbi:hypothetical protein [Novacetimonas hansenii]|uniref:hypothetical protein n=1 Tax=Novacetimonas hansenii TaxID=436 RepID=UPI000A752DF6|nr:hypothetical protein [Novacetimonas hansenii]
MRYVAAWCAARGIPFARFRIRDLRHPVVQGRWDIYWLNRHRGHISVKTTEIYLFVLTADELDPVLHVDTEAGTEAP